MRIPQLVEFIDIYPTLCDLCGIDQPGHLHGNSMVSLLNGDTASWKDAVFSRWIAGDTVITKNYAFTEWYTDGKTTARMLFDHQTDPYENVNVAEDDARQDLIEQMSARLKKNRQMASEIPAD
jgi:arylsulfatase A-like enzyme